MKKSEGGIPFTVLAVYPAGSESTIQLKNDNVELMVKYHGDTDYPLGGTVWVTYSQNKINAYDKVSGNLISDLRRQDPLTKSYLGHP